MKINIYEIRTEKELTLREVAKLSGVSKSQINAVENEKISPTLKTLELLAVGLKVSVHDLFSE